MFSEATRLPARQESRPESGKEKKLDIPEEAKPIANPKPAPTLAAKANTVTLC